MNSPAPKDLFSEQAHFYSRFRPEYPDKMYQFIFKHLDQKQEAWDCGTGSGQVAGYLAKYFKKIYASDISTGQLKYAVQKKNIEYSKTPAEKTDYQNDLFDLITVAQAIHWFDFDAFYKEVKRVAKQNALIAVIGYGMIQTDPEFNQIIEELYNSAFGKYFKNCRKYVFEEYKTIPFPFEEIPSPRFSIEYNWTVNHLEGFFNSWSSIQKFKAAEGYNPANHIIEQIRKKRGNNSFKVSFPVFLRLGQIHKTEDLPL